MKKMKFDMVVESLLEEGRFSKQKMYGNKLFDLSKIIDLIGDQKSEFYQNNVIPFVEKWSNKSYLGNISPTEVNSIFRLTVHKFENLLNDDVEKIPYTELSSIIDNIYKEKFKGHKEGMSTLARRWSNIVKAFFENMSDAQSVDQNAIESDEFGEVKNMEELDNSNEDSFNDSPSQQIRGIKGIENSLLKVIQGAGSLSREDVVEYLTRERMQEPEMANKIISRLLASKELIEKNGALEINKETKELEAFGIPRQDEFEDESGIPFREIGPEEEDSEIADRISSMRLDDEDFYRSGR